MPSYAEYANVTDYPICTQCRFNLPATDMSSPAKNRRYAKCGRSLEAARDELRARYVVTGDIPDPTDILTFCTVERAGHSGCGITGKYFESKGSGPELQAIFLSMGLAAPAPHPIMAWLSRLRAWGSMKLRSLHGKEH